MTAVTFPNLAGSIPGIDKDFRPMALENRNFIKAVKESGEGAPLAVCIERADGLRSTFRTQVFAESSARADANFLYVERFVKTILWSRGGWKIIIGGPANVCEAIKKAYSKGGLREFDADFMSKVYEKPFVVEVMEYDKVPGSYEVANPVGRHLNGYRIGFDAGGSDMKVSAVIDGEVVFSEEIIWHPKTQSDPEYHYKEILSAMKTAAAHMPRVDAIGVSSAGVYINNRTMVASLFRLVPEELFNSRIKDVYLNIQKEMGGVPLAVANDGDVAALAGAMDFNATNVMGIAMGTSEAGGYVDHQGNITGWLNELAFIPVDANPGAAVDEWAGDYGCGVKYFSQDGVIRLADMAGIELDPALTPAEKLKVVQDLLKNGDERAVRIFETIGVYLGYTVAHYADFYDINHILILGRVTSGEGGNIIFRVAQEILQAEFPDLAQKIKLQLPSESYRRVGQSIAAASLAEA